MFAVRASHVVDAIGDLMSAKHSLCKHSQCDSKARDHSDGWGVACYHTSGLRWTRQSSAAYADPRFDEMIHRCLGKTIVAHVRRASRGSVHLENSHPFVFGNWTFVHNGTLTSLDALRPRLLKEIGQSLRSNIKGETDSELIFYWMLQRLADGSAVRGDRCVSLPKMRLIFAASVLELDRRNAAEQERRGTDEVARLNFILTNGSTLIGSRLRHTLFVLQQHKKHPTGQTRRTIAIASEPTDGRAGKPGRAWKPVPESSVYTINGKLQWYCEPLQREDFGSGIAKA